MYRRKVIVVGLALLAGCTGEETDTTDEEPADETDEEPDNTDDQSHEESWSDKELLISFEVVDEPPEDADIITGDDPSLDELDALRQVYEDLAREADVVIESEEDLAEFDGTLSGGQDIDPESSEWKAARERFPVHFEYEDVVFHSTYNITSPD